LVAVQWITETDGVPDCSSDLFGALLDALEEARSWTVERGSAAEFNSPLYDKCQRLQTQ
jgi:hypothetical protein